MKTYLNHARPYTRICSFAILIGIIACLFLSWNVNYTHQPIDCVHNGRTLSSWVDDLNSSSPETRSNATIAVRAIGTNAAPLLLKYLSQSDNSLPQMLHNTWEKLIRKSPSGLPRMLRGQAVDGFETLGPLGYSAIPELKRLMLNPELAYDAARALGTLRVDDTLPLFRDLLNHTEAKLRSAGAAGLGSMGLQARPTIPYLVKTIRDDKDEGVRATAADALGSIGPGDVVVPILWERIKMDGSINVRICAVYALHNFPEGSDELKKIVKADEGDVPERIRSVARLALQMSH